MSIQKNTFALIGLDLTAHKESILTDAFVDSDLYNELTCMSKIGKIHLFTDPMDGGYMYFGHVFFECDEDYSDAMSSILVQDIADIAKDVANQCFMYFGINSTPQVIVFNQFT